METLIVCKECKSENIEVKVWYNLNTDRASIEYLNNIEDEDTWCCECQEHTGIETVNK